MVNDLWLTFILFLQYEDPLAARGNSPSVQELDRNMIDPSILFAKKAEPGGLIKELLDWIYRDPQGEIQGLLYTVTILTPCPGFISMVVEGG